MSLRDKIKDNFRNVHGIAEGDTRLAIATHDNLYWVVVTANHITQCFRSSRGHETEEAALQEMAQGLSDKVWEKAKKDNITLSK